MCSSVFESCVCTIVTMDEEGQATQDLTKLELIESVHLPAVCWAFVS